MRERDTDRGLKAVARVRGVVEHNARLELQMALAEQHRHEALLQGMNDMLAASNPAFEGDAGMAIANRAAMMSLGVAMRDEKASITAAEIFVEVKRQHWSKAETELTAVEQLLERRKARRDAERQRRIAGELDEIASQRWLKARSDSMVELVETRGEIA